MFQNTRKLVFSMLGKRGYCSALRTINPNRSIRKPILANVGRKARRVRPTKTLVPYHPNRELNLDLLRPESVNRSPSILDKVELLMAPPDRIGNDDYYPQAEEFDEENENEGPTKETDKSRDDDDYDKLTLRQIKLYLGETDCGEGGANRPTRGLCDPPEGPCEPMKPPGYPAKPRPRKEPFCVKCPPKRPCNLNKCPADTEGTCCSRRSTEIALILYSQSQRSCSHGVYQRRNYGTYNGRWIIEDLRTKAPVRWKSGNKGGGGCGAPPEEPAKCSNPLPKPPETCEKKVIESPVCKPKETKPPPTPCGAPEKKEDPPVRVVYQKCPPVPKLPKLPECVPPAPKVEIKCPPLPECPKPPVCPPPEEPASKCGLPPPPADSCTASSKKAGIMDKLSGFFKKRKMSTSAGSNDWKSRKCKTVTDICTADPSDGKNSASPAYCPKERKTSCHVEKVKCSDTKKPPVVDKPPEIPEKMDYSKVTCPPTKFEKLESCPARARPAQAASECGDKSKTPVVMELPKPPSEPVTLCPCPPPPKLHPGACPCAQEPRDLKRIFSVQSCVPKDKFPCPDKKVFYCPPQRPQRTKINN